MSKKNTTNTASTETSTTGTGEYKPNSQILRAYNAGIMPVSHRILYNAFKATLNGATEGEINLAEVLQSIGIHRSSAMTSIRHMQNFGVIEFTTNYSSTPGERGEWRTHVRLLRDPEQSELPKSA